MKLYSWPRSSGTRTAWALEKLGVAVASWLGFGTMLGLELDKHPRVVAWLRRCGERPAFKRAR